MSAPRPTRLANAILGIYGRCRVELTHAARADRRLPFVFDERLALEHLRARDATCQACGGSGSTTGHGPGPDGDLLVDDCRPCAGTGAVIPSAAP